MKKTLLIIGLLFLVTTSLFSQSLLQTNGIDRVKLNAFKVKKKTKVEKSPEKNSKNTTTPPTTPPADKTSITTPPPTNTTPVTSTPNDSPTSIDGLANVVFTGTTMVPSINILGSNRQVDTGQGLMNSFIQIRIFGVNTNVAKDLTTNENNVFINEASVYGFEMAGGVSFLNTGNGGKIIQLQQAISYVGKSFPDPSNKDTTNIVMAVYGAINCKTELELAATKFLGFYYDFNYLGIIKNVSKYETYFNTTKKDFIYSEIGIEGVFNTNAPNTQSICLRIGAILYNGGTQEILPSKDPLLLAITIGFKNPFKN